MASEINDSHAATSQLADNLMAQPRFSPTCLFPGRQCCVYDAQMKTTNYSQKLLENATAEQTPTGLLNCQCVSAFQSIRHLYSGRDHESVNSETLAVRLPSEKSSSEPWYYLPLVECPLYPTFTAGNDKITAKHIRHQPDGPVDLRTLRYLMQPASLPRRTAGSDSETESGLITSTGDTAPETRD